MKKQQLKSPSRKSEVAPAKTLFAPPRRVDLSLHEWRDREDLVLESRRIAGDPHFRLMLEILLNESPVNYMNPRLPAERALGHIEGYNMALNNLAALSVLGGEKITIQADFSPDNSKQA